MREMHDLLVAYEEGLARRYPASQFVTRSPNGGATMPHYLSAHELGQTAPAELESFESPVPTQVVSNGEYNPLPQTREQRPVEARIKELADDLGPRPGLNRRPFLAN